MKKIIKWRNNKLNAWLMDAVIFMLLMLLFSWWQTRHTLDADGQLAPDFNLTSLEGLNYQFSQFQGQKVLVYFFAPWCSICRHSADNLNDLRDVRDDSEWMIVAVALSYDSQDAVREFVADVGLEIPVLLGTEQQMQDYQIQAFPTYYLTNEKGELTHRSVGYSTELGMRVRTW